MVHGRVDYDQVATSYNLRYGALQYEGAASTLLSLARAGPAERVLEVGCGTGHWLAQLQAVSPYVYGLDSSTRMLQQTHPELRDRLVCGEAGHLPFGEAVFDLIFCGIAEHIVRSVTGAEVLQSPFLQNGGTSQLALSAEEAYAAGLERIKVDLLQAEKTGVPLEFVVDVSLALVTGSAP
jgi:SAM-dependent methyltransferase